MKQLTLLFDYVGFQHEASPFIERADAGDYQAITRHAQGIAKDLSPDEWILESFGTSLLGFKELSPGPWLTGFAFLVLLSQFLRRNPIGHNFGTIANTVSQLGWTEDEAALISDGMATTHLIRPGQLPGPATDLRWHSPSYYWWWLRPANAYKTKWWDISQITFLYEKLLDTESRIQQLGGTSQDVLNSSSYPDLLIPYQRTLELFHVAIVEQVGLFNVLAY